MRRLPMRAFQSTYAGWNNFPKFLRAYYANERASLALRAAEWHELVTNVAPYIPDADHPPESQPGSSSTLAHRLPLGSVYAMLCAVGRRGVLFASISQSGLILACIRWASLRRNTCRLPDPERH